MTRLPLLLLCLASIAYARTHRRPHAKASPPKLARDPRRIVPGDYPPKTLLFVDVDLGLFGRGSISDFMPIEKQYAVRVMPEGFLRVHIPETHDLRTRVATWMEFDVQEVLLLNRVGRWELIGRRGRTYFNLENVPPKEVQIEGIR